MAAHPAIAFVLEVRGTSVFKFCAYIYMCVFFLMFLLCPRDVPYSSAPILVGPRPEYPQTTVDKVASAFELDFIYLFT